MISFADAHIHICDGCQEDAYPDLEQASLLFGCVAKTEEWDGMLSRSEDNVIRFLGIHPWYAGQWDGSAEDRLRSELASDPGIHVGEIGMDSKRGDVDVQRPAFMKQLELASEFGRMANIHMIGCEREVLESIRKHGNGCIPILHSFSSESYVKPFAELGCMFSLNPRVLAKSEDRIRNLMSRIPEDRLLLESDAPYVTKGFKGMLEFASKLSGIAELETEELIIITERNARRIADV